MTRSHDQAEAIYAQASVSLLSHADDEAVRDGVATLVQCRTAYEAVRIELLEDFPDIEGPLIGDLLGEAAGHVWPSIIHDL